MRTVVICIIVYAVIGCGIREENTNYQKKTKSAMDSLSVLNNSFRKANTVLRNENDSLRNMLSYWFTNKHHANQLRDLGIEEPNQRVIEEFKKQGRLIPMEAILGGTIHFGHAQLLGTSWIIAEFDDGHVMGVGLYRFEVLKDSTLRYELIEWKSE